MAISSLDAKEDVLPLAANPITVQKIQQASAVGLSSLSNWPGRDSENPSNQHCMPGQHNEMKIEEAMKSNKEGHDITPTSSAASFQQHVIGDEESQEYPMPTYFSSSSATGLGVDSDLSETNIDDDSAIGSSVYSLTGSARSDLYDFVEENGRTYHRFKEGKYHLPNDEVSGTSV